MKITPNDIQTLNENEIFVFGSNAVGSHGGGAAWLAHRQFGALMGVGEGFTGQCYAVPTLDVNLERVQLRPLFNSLQKLRNEILANPDKHFLITRLGCGIAGFQDFEVAPLMYDFTELENVSLPKEFIEILEKHKAF